MSQANRAKPKKTGPSNIAICVAETVGTGLLLFLGCMGCIHVGGQFIHHFVALTFALAILLIIQIFGHISGAHLNPAVTIGAVYVGMVDYKVAPFYFSGQFAGGIIGFGLLKLLVPAQFTTNEKFDTETNTTIYTPGLCTTIPHEDVTILQALSIETILTAVLILICCAVWDKRNANHHDSVSIRFGLSIAALAMAGGPFTGCSMNTARSFAPALLNGYWNNHWIYWVAPNVGAVIAAGFYKFMWPAPEDTPADEEEMTDLTTRNNVTTKA